MKVFKYLKKYWYFALLAPLFMVGEVIFDLLQPKLMEKIVDQGVLSNLVASDKIEIVVNTGLLMLGCLVVGGLCGILSGVCASAAANSFGDDVRKDVFSKVVNLSYQQTDSFTTGSLVTRITNDVTQVQNFVSMAIRMFVRTIVLFFGGILMMYLTSPKFAIVLAVILPIQVLLIFIFLRKMTPIFGVVQSKIDKVNTVVQENVNGVRVVKAYVRENYEKDRFNDANVDLSLTTLKVQKIFAWVSPLMMIFMNVIVVAIIYLGGIEISQNPSAVINGEAGVMTVGKVMSALTYIAQVLMSVMQFAMIFQSITRAKVCAKRIEEVLNSSPVITSNVSRNSDYNIKEKDKGTIEFKNVDFSYPSLSGKPVISNLNLKINKGEVIAILGATGSGKSSIVNLIPRFYDVTNGEVLVDGINVKDYNLFDLREKISMILQKTELFSGTIEENIKWGKEDASLEGVQEVAKIAQADDFINSFKEGYNSQVGERGNNLSGGQKQRISIARGIIKKPEFLIFDDATSALDLATEAKLHKALKENLDDVTTIIIAQRVASAKNADRIAVIDNGCLVDFDTHENLMKNCAIYQDIYNSQLKRGEEDEF